MLTWQHRLVRVREQCHDLFGNRGWRWRLERRSNAYQLLDPAARTGAPAAKSDDRTGTPDQEISKPLPAPAIDPTSPLGRALARLGTALAAKAGIEQGAGG